MEFCHSLFVLEGSEDSILLRFPRLERLGVSYDMLV